MAGLVRDLDAAMVQCSAVEELFSHDLPYGVDRLPAGCLDIGKILALGVAVKVAAFAYVEEIAGHGIDTAALFITVTRGSGSCSSRSPGGLPQLAGSGPVPL